MFMTNTYYTLFVYDERVRIPVCVKRTHEMMYVYDEHS